ncbi:MAG: hypothetical protein HY000_15445, partial [Planctomycetes bacterium]|nr:hypothetical protein [Planctomycetota bacterium]
MRHTNIRLASLSLGALFLLSFLGGCHKQDSAPLAAKAPASKGPGPKTPEPKDRAQKPAVPPPAVVERRPPPEMPPYLKEPPAEPFLLPTEQQLAIDPAIEDEVRPLVAASRAGTSFPPKDAPTRSDFARAVADWHRATFMESYQQFGVRNPAYDADAINFITDFTAATSTGELTGDAVQTLRLQGEALVKAGCEDPLVLYLLARLQYGFGGQPDFPRAMRTVGAAVAGFENTRYPPKVTYRATLLQARVLSFFRAPGAERASEDQYAIAVNQLVQALSVRGFLPAEQRILFQRVRQDLSEMRAAPFHKLLATVCATENVDHWIAAMLEGREQFRLGWESRGSGAAYTVTEQGWRDLDLRLRRSRKLLLDAWKLHPEFPEAATEMIKVTRAMPGAQQDTPRFWFEQAVKAEFDYLDAYKELRWSLRPRWGGSHEAMLQFGRECLATERFDTEVPWQFAIVLTEIAGEMEDDPRAIYRQPGVYEDFERLAAGYRKVQGSKERQLALDSQLGCVAWLAGRDEQARAIFDRLGNRVRAEALPEFGTTWIEIKQALYPNAGLAESRLDEDRRFRGHEGEVAD